MKRFGEKLVVLMLLVVLFIPVYSWIVQVVNASPPSNLVKSFSLKSASEGRASNVFDAGDTLVLIVESDLADAYELTIYQNSSAILFENGKFEGGKGVVSIRLYPPSFRGGNTYSAVCRTLVLNDPIPGAYFSDVVSSVFTVMTAETKLVFSADYDCSVGSLYLNAQLTDLNDNFPVVNETIDFSWQRANTKRLTEGWSRFGSSKTDVNGVANLSLAFGLPNGNYLVRAWHKSNENFGESKNIADLEAFFNMSVIENLSLGLPSLSGFRVSSLPTPDPNVTIAVSNSTPYVLLQMNATARYSTDVRYDRGLRFVFFCDFINVTGFVNATDVAFPGSGPPYIYEGNLPWEPSVIGSHKLIAVVTGTEIANLTRVIHQGTDIIAFNEAQLDILRCPSNVVVDFPEALYGDSLPVSVAVSKPRSYEPASDGFYNATTLAPELTYNGMEFVIDEGVNSTLVNLFVNGTVFSNQTDGSGVAYFRFGFNPSDLHATLNITALVDGSSLLNETVFGQVVSFTRVNVTDVPGAMSGDFAFGYKVNGISGGGTLFDQVEDPLNIEASLLNRSLWNAPVSVVGAKHISNLKVLNNSRTGWDVPVLSDYLRVYKYFYNTSVAADINNDNTVDIKDLSIVAKAYGSYPGAPNWNIDADIDGDNRVDIKDLAIVAKYYGVSNVSRYEYLPLGVYLVFQPGDQMVSVDTQGAARIPSGARNFTVWWTGKKIGAFINFTEITLDETFQTNNFGEVSSVWAPFGAGKYLLQVKLPSSLSAVVASYTGVSSIASSLNFIDWYDVVKRPLNLSVTYEPGEVTLDTPVTMIANVYDMAMKGPANGWPVRFYIKNGSGDWVYIWTVFTNSSGIATLTWLPRDYVGFPSWNFTLKAHIWETDHTRLTEKLISVDARFPTHLEFVTHGGDVISVPSGANYEVFVKLTNGTSGAPLNNRQVYLYRNGSAHYATYALTNTSGIGRTVWNGPAYF